MTTISMKRRKKSASVVVDGKPKYPIDSVHTAKSAVKLIHNAKPPLTPAQRAKVLKDAAAYGAYPKSKQLHRDKPASS